MVELIHAWFWVACLIMECTVAVVVTVFALAGAILVCVFMVAATIDLMRLPFLFVTWLRSKVSKKNEP